ncbi:hypothetical protein EW146_g2158 [Bondarzewia mesenterica]|uniref:DUF1746 domain-containing protein n=1 Tax=Bondarzewia mesenterica TaxID=1095465 RepID=A0A4S4M1N2_9AGAM|nr:hypothetical protein EW146_g2158 [Bondarzewia mesenterica]
MSSPAPSRLSFFLDMLKPSYTEAVLRLKSSLMALLALVTLTQLLPLPTLYSSLWRVYRGSYNSTWEKTISLTEFCAFCVLMLNILQASYAIHSPRKPYAPTPSPAKPPPSFLKSPRGGPATPSKRSKLHGLSPSTTPQRQKPFTPSSSYTPSDPLNLAQSYSLSFSTPSPDSSFASSVSLPPSPSPLAAYRGRQGIAVGRELFSSSPILDPHESSLACRRARACFLLPSDMLCRLETDERVLFIGPLDASLLARLSQEDLDDE